MELNYIITIITAVLSFSISFVWLRKIMIIKNYDANPPLLLRYAYLPVYTMLVISFLVMFFLFQQEEDMLYTPNLFNTLIPLACAGIVFWASLFFKQYKYQLLVNLLCVTAAALTAPKDMLFFNQALPFWADRGLVVLIWLAFTSLYKFLNGIEGILSVQTIGFFAGIFVLFFLDIAPVMYGMLSICIIAVISSFAVFNWYPEKLSLSAGACSSLGFICGWIFVISGYESYAPCTTIFMMFFFYEVFIAFAKRMSFLEQYKDIYSNTDYYQANISGLSPADVCNHVMKLEVILIIFGCFELYSPNVYSLPLFCFLFTAWFAYRMKNWQIAPKTFRQINKDIIDDVSKDFADFKESFRKDDQK